MHSILLRSLAAVALAMVSLGATAATVWDGDPITFEKPIPSTTATVDAILPGIVELTRGSSGGLYNSVTESRFRSNSSPDDVEWAFSGRNGNGTASLANYDSLTYANWKTAVDEHAQSIAGVDGVMHIISEDIYIGVTMDSWRMGGTAFAYTRTTEPTVVPLPAALPLFLGAVAGLGVMGRRRRRT